MHLKKLKTIRTGTARGVALGVGGLLLAAGQPAFAQSPTVQNLQTQIQKMQVQIDELERDVVVPDAPGSFKLPGTDTSMKIGGYVKGDFIYDLDQDIGNAFDATVIDPNRDDDDTNFRAHALQSRIFFSTSTPTDAGTVKTHIEGDFFTGEGNEFFSNSRGFRIRHAWGSMGGWLAGQTWSNFMQFTAYPSTVDFNGPVGVTFVRQGQLRYTMPVENGALSFSIENPEGLTLQNAQAIEGIVQQDPTANVSGSLNDKAPDVTAKFKGSFGALGVEAAVLGRYLETDSAVATGDDSEFGYGVMLAGSFQLTPATRLMASAVYGDGVGRYIFVNVGEAVIDGDGDLDPIEALGFNVAVAQQWTPMFSSSLSYGRVERDLEKGMFANNLREQQTVHFSNFVKVADPVTLGLEAIYGDIELENGNNGDAARLQASAQYSF
ncbi:DcaP family trimeric outer membrane transporter [Marinobacter sp.]|uniref:DcaP family trimeric outer membrane transporter n=1 Tax=Marinobacter sp. TaxID=50741 RepID=UPI00384C53FD